MPKTSNRVIPIHPHKHVYKIVLLLCLFFIKNAYGFDISITRAELGFGIIPEYNRSFYYSWDIMTTGSVEFNKNFILGSGVSMGQVEDIFDINTYINAEYGFPFFRPYVPMVLKIAYIYNGLPEYETHIHTLLPTFSFKWRYFGGSIGSTLRFTTFDKNPAIFEPIIAYSAYLNFYNTDDAVIGIGLSNYDDFNAANLGSYSFNLNNRIRITNLISLSNVVEIAMSGNVGHIVSVYGISYGGMIIFKW
ncbi:hypothetical protein LQZ19_10020 [Treponema primitia]|uniref:hypothetical protein n=1 Tax=Treponema primitia TaxID=88058 RepID=UPI0039809FE4